MAGYRKLGRTSSQRKALLRNQVTNLLYHGRITTTVTKAKEIRREAEKLITLAIREKDNYETVEVKVKVPVKDKDGKRVKEVVDGKKQLIDGWFCGGLGYGDPTPDDTEDNKDMRLEYGYAGGNFWYGHTVHNILSFYHYIWIIHSSPLLHYIISGVSAIINICPISSFFYILPIWTRAIFILHSLCSSCYF